MSAHTPGPLSDACMAILADRDFYAVESDWAPEEIGILDDEGNHLFYVHSTIRADDLKTMLRIHAVRFSLGKEAGRKEMAESLRQLLGVAKATGGAQ